MHKTLRLIALVAVAASTAGCEVEITDRISGRPNQDASDPPPLQGEADAAVPDATEPLADSGAALDAGVPKMSDDAAVSELDASAPDAAAPPAPAPVVLVRALRLEIHQTIDFPVADEQETTFTMLGRVTLSLTSTGAATFRMEFCQLAMDADPEEILVSFPPGAIRGFKDVVVNTTLPPLEVGIKVDLPAVVQLAGWTSPSPANDPLPGEADDPRVIDGDQDGNPGITTVMAEPIESDVYIAARTTMSLHGTLVSLDRVEGYADGVVEQALLGGSRGVVPEEILDVLPAADPRVNTFLLVSIPGPDSCADILAGAALLFP